MSSKCRRALVLIAVYAMVLLRPLAQGVPLDAPQPPAQPPTQLSKTHVVDVDGNGFVNGDDADTFGRWFIAGDIRADFDGNGFVNGEDFDAFTAAFARGGFVATTYTINSAVVEEHGGVLELVCTGATPTRSGPLDSIAPLVAGKSRSLSSAQKIQFIGSCQGSSGGTTTLILRFAVDPDNRVPFTGPTSGITFSADAGFLQDRYGNTVGGVSALTVNNLSLVDSAGLPHATPFTTRPAGSVEYFVNWKDGNDTTGTGTLGSPFKTKRKAGLALAANGHLTDGSFVSVVTDGTSAYDEAITGPNQYMRVNLGGPNPWQRGMVRPVNTSGVFVNTLRNKTFITPGGTDNTRTAFVRTGGGDAEGLSLISNQLIYGQHVESSDMSDECKHGAFSYNQPADTFMFWECVARGLQGGAAVQDSSGNAAMKNVVWYRNTWDKIFDVDPTGTEPGHAIAVFVDGTSGRNSFYEDVFTDCAYNEATLTEGDIFGRPIYVSDSSGGGGPSSIVGCVCYNSADNFAQQRTGGWYFGNKNDRSPMDAYGGNAWGWNAACNVASRLRDADAVGSPPDERGQGLFGNGSTHPTDAPTRITQNIATGKLAGSIDQFNNRSFGESGTQTGCSIQVDHNVGNDLGPLIAHLPKPGNVYEDGGQPYDLLFEDNINTNTTGSELHAVAVGMIPTAGMGWLRGLNNCLVTSNAAKFAFVDQIGSEYTKSAWEAVATGFVTSDTSAPTFTDSARDVLKWLQSTAELSGMNEVQCYAAVRSRALGAWPSWAKWKASWVWIATGWVDSGKVRSSSANDRKGITPGFIEMDFAFGGPGMGNGHLFNSVNLEPVASALYKADPRGGVNGQNVLQVVSDSKYNPNVGGANQAIATQFNLCAGLLTDLGLPINGINIPAGGSSAYCGGYTNLGGASGIDYTSENTRFPGDTFTEGYSAVLPVMARDVQVRAVPGTNQTAIVIQNVNKDVLPANRSSPLNTSSASVRHRIFLYQTSRTHSIMNCLFGKNSAIVQDFVTRDANVNQIRTITCSSLLTSNLDQNPKDSLGYRGNSPSVTLGSVNDMWVTAGGDVRWTDVGPGVHLATPIIKGGWTTDDHNDETKYTAAGLADYYTKTNTPTILWVDIGQNLTSAQATQFGLGSNALFKQGVKDLVNKHLTAIATANTNNGVTAPAVKVVLVAPYRTGYSQAYTDLMQDAMYDLAIENNWSFINLYKLSPLNTNDSLWATLGSGGQTWTTYTCDGVHPNYAGMVYFMSVIRAEMQTAMQQNVSQPTNGFEWVDPLELARSAGNLPYDYTVDGGVQAIASGNLELRMPGRVLKSLRGSDWLIGDGQVTLPPFVSKTGNTDKIKLIACKDGADFYYAELTLAGANTPWVLGRGGINTATYGSGTHGSAIVATDVLKLVKSSTTMTLYKNGVSIATATITDTSPLISGEWGVEGPYIIGSTVKFGGTAGFRVGVLSPYVPPSRAKITTPRLIKFVSTFDPTGGYDDTHAGVPTSLWNNGWDSYLAAIDTFIAQGGKHVWIRGTGGNTSESLVFARSYYKGGVDNSTASACNMANQHYAGYLRDTAAVFAHPLDGRLGDNFLTALTSRKLDGIIFHECLPPNGRDPNTPNSVIGTAWPNSSTAFDFYWLAARAVGAELSFDTAGSMDPLHAQSLVAAAGLARAKTYLAGRKPFLESHTEQVAVGTLGTWPNNTALADGTVAWMSDYTRYLTLYAHPDQWLGKDEVGPVESIVIIDQGSVPAIADRIAAIRLALKRGWSVVAELDDMTNAQIQGLISAFNAGSGTSRGGRVDRGNVRINR